MNQPGRTSTGYMHTDDQATIFTKYLADAVSQQEKGSYSMTLSLFGLYSESLETKKGPEKFN